MSKIVIADAGPLIANELHGSFAPAAAMDLQRLFDFLADSEFIEVPFSCRKASPEHPLLRELIISFGVNGSPASLAYCWFGGFERILAAWHH